jgi:hypothetical protein
MFKQISNNPYLLFILLAIQALNLEKLYLLFKNSLTKCWTSRFARKLKRVCPVRVDSAQYSWKLKIALELFGLRVQNSIWPVWKLVFREEASKSK